MADWDIKDASEYLENTIVPKRLLAEIGAIAIYFSHLDHAVTYTISAILDLNSRQESVLLDSIQSFSSRIELLKKLALQKHTDENERERIGELAQQLRFAGDDRNRLMHDEIFTSDSGEGITAISTMRPGASSGTQMHRFDVETMTDLQHRLTRLEQCLLHYVRADSKWLTEPLPSLDRSPTLRLRREYEPRQRAQGKRPRPPKS